MTFYVCEFAPSDVGGVTLIVGSAGPTGPYRVTAMEGGKAGHRAERAFDGDPHEAARAAFRQLGRGEAPGAELRAAVDSALADMLARLPRQLSLFGCY